MADQNITQEQTVRLAPFQEEFLADIFASAKALTGEGTQMPFAKQEVSRLITRATTSYSKRTKWSRWFSTFS